MSLQGCQTSEHRSMVNMTAKKVGALVNRGPVCGDERRRPVTHTLFIGLNTPRVNRPCDTSGSAIILSETCGCCAYVLFLLMTTQRRACA